MCKRNLGIVIALAIFGLLVLAGCGSTQKAPETPTAQDLSGDLIVYHAGSLAIPFEAIEKEFETLYPDVDVKRTPGGSVDLARMISEIGDSVDIIASADYTVIDKLLIPEHAKWNAMFAANSMVIMYTDKSKNAAEINADNWYEILLKDGINYGYSDPNADPCGYRSRLVMQLAEKYYEKPGLNQQLVDGCPEKNIRPKSVELISLLETGALDYAFEYESVAMQHAAKNSIFKYVKLPAEINFSAVEHKDFYNTASIELKGSSPGETIKQIGEPIVFSLAMPASGKNNAAAYEFVKFLFDAEKGMKILQEQGQPILDKITVTGAENLPDELKGILK